jgi:Protein of unknown function (DUF3710)
VFRRRRIRDTDPAARDGSEDEYPAADEAAEDDDYDEEYEEEYDLYDEEDGEDEEDLEDEAAFEDEGLGVEAEESEAASPGESAMAQGADGGSRRGRRADRDDLGDPLTWTRLRDTAATEPANVRLSGPWDSGDEYPEAERLDLGCLQVPVGEGSNVQLAYSEETGVTLAIVAGDSALQLQAFAAPRSSGLWHKVRPEIGEEVARAGGRSQEQEGPFGPELLAWVTPQVEGQGQLPQQPLRFLGADGPRWFLRGLISGPAALDKSLARPLEEVFAGVVVVRGDHAAPPETPLEIQLPEEARQAFADQAQAEAEQTGMPNPFERGPEITETR